jgi:hypothetical protein
MIMFDASHLTDLTKIISSLSKDNVGDAMIRASAIRGIIVDPTIKVKADQVLDTIRNFARQANIDWKVFETPIIPELVLKETQVWQVIAVIGTLVELNYCFERVEEASIFTFENSAPVRFYVNGIFHYLASLFLLDGKDNKKKGFIYPGALIKALQPMGLEGFLEPVYKIFDRQFGEEKTYGETILAVRNKQFVHGSFSPENVQRVVKDSHIFDELQRARFVQNHWDLFDQLVILRLKLISTVAYSNISPDDFSPSKLFHL